MFLRSSRERRSIRATDISRSQSMRAGQTESRSLRATRFLRNTCRRRGRSGSRVNRRRLDATATAASPDILLSGEVVANDSGGGPRLVIDIESFDQSGRIARVRRKRVAGTSHVGRRRAAKTGPLGLRSGRCAFRGGHDRERTDDAIPCRASGRHQGRWCDGTLGEARANQRRQAV